MVELIKCKGKCKRELPPEAFYKNRSMKNGLQIFCKECTKEIVKKYEKKKKEGTTQKLNCSVCGKKLAWNSIEGKCGDCRHREKMRLKYHENPAYYKTKHADWRKRRAATNKEIEFEETNRLYLTKGEIFLLTRFNGDDWMPQHQIDPRKLFSEEIEHLYELGLIETREIDNLIEYVLTEKALTFLGKERK